MEITEQRLSDFGGWQAMKQARERVKSRQVTDAKRDEKGFHGMVGLGKACYRASLLVDGRGQVEGKCACAEGRRGVICDHVLAVALQVIKGPVAPAGIAVATGAQAKPSNKAGIGKREDGKREEVKLPPAPKGVFHVSIMTTHLERLEKGGTIPVFFRFEAGENEVAAELWQWLSVRGLGAASHGVRLEGDELLSLLDVAKGNAQVWSADERSKNKSNLFIVNDLNGLYINNVDKLSESIDFKLNEQLFYSGDRLKLYGFKLKEGEVLFRLNDASTTFVNKLMVNKKLEVSFKDIVKNLTQYIKVFGDVENWFSELKIRPIKPDFTLSIEGSLKRLLLQLEVVVPRGRYFLSERDVNYIYPIQDEYNKFIFYIRNENDEAEAQRRLTSLGLKEVSLGIWELGGEAEVLRFMAAELPRLKRDFEIKEGAQWQSMAKSLAVIRPQLKASEKDRDEGSGVVSGMDWLNLEVAYESVEGVRVSRNEVLRLIRSGQRQGRTAEGKRFVLDVEGCEDLEETLHDLSARLEDGGGRMAIRRRQAGVLTEFAGKQQQWGELGEALGDQELGEGLAELGGRLRHYQLDGVRWMERLGRAGLGGLLADEMGLGKTVQTLGLVRMLLRGKKGEPALVICPTSLLSNWRDEAHKFVPDLRVHISHEAGRHEHWDRLKDYDVIFTSYQLVARDLEQLNKLMFSVVVMDEASYVRNAETVASKAVRQLRTRACFALTGTPVENSLKDLWSIFEVVMPGYLPSKENFHERYVKNMAQADSRQARAAMERLRRLLRPYMLRRTKREVVKELPEKMEQVVWCELTPLQKELYTRILEEGREEIRQARRKSGQGSARMTMFTVLLRLRQVCNDVRLLGMDGNGKEVTELGGGKWDRFDEMVQELVEGDHRALVFSQFVGMLKLVRERLDKAGIEYCYLDGSTRDRAGQVTEFQREGSTKRFFLISLKAGGYGLNLTAADHVLLMDPWWNPAVEAQAIDRAHRIGQGRPVTAERFVMRGTVEEKILQLQEKKRAVMDMAMDENATVMAGVTDEELDEILNFG